jgi:hypothetical protein
MDSGCSYLACFFETETSEQLFFEEALAGDDLFFSSNLEEGCHRASRTRRGLAIGRDPQGSGVSRR